jgi:hypothetical protein
MRKNDVDLEEATDMAGCYAEDLMKLATSGTLKARMEGGRVLFVRQEIEELERFDGGGWSSFLAKACRKGRARGVSKRIRKTEVILEEAMKLTALEMDVLLTFAEDEKLKARMVGGNVCFLRKEIAAISGSLDGR